MMTRPRTQNKLRLGVLAAGLMLITTVGCMVSPGNQQVLETRFDSILFSGFTVHPEQDVEIFAQNANQSWVKIGQAVSEDVAYEHFDGKWYYWSKKIVVPESLWQQWGKDGGFSVIVKAVADKNDLIAFEDGFYDYFDEYDSLEELYLENQSLGGANVLIWAKK